MPQKIGTPFAQLLSKPPRTMIVLKLSSPNKKGNFMKLSLLRLLSLSTLLAFVGASKAFAQYGQEEKVAYVHAYLQKGDKIDLMQELGLSQALQSGVKVSAFKVEASSYSQAKMVLKYNGQKYDTQQIGTYSSNLSFEVPQSLYPQDKLVLVAKGDMSVTKVTAYLKPAYSSYPPRGAQAQALKAQVNQQVYGQEVFPVKKLVKDSTGVSLRGMEVKKVLIKASKSSYYGQASAQLEVNGQLVGFPQYFSKEMTKFVFEIPSYMPKVFGQGLRSVKLVVRGDAFVKMVGLKTKGQAQGGGYQQAYQFMVNKSFYRSERVSLVELFPYNAPRMDYYAPVEVLTVEAVGSGNIMVTGGGQVLETIAVAGSYGTSRSIRVAGLASVNDIKLRVTGRVTIKSIRIKMGY